MSTAARFSTVNSYIIVEYADRYIDFLVRAFEAKERGRTNHEGRIANACLQIGESMVMVIEGV